MRHAGLLEQRGLVKDNVREAQIPIGKRRRAGRAINAHATDPGVPRGVLSGGAAFHKVAGGSGALASAIGVMICPISRDRTLQNSPSADADPSGCFVWFTKVSGKSSCQESDNKKAAKRKA